MNTNTTDILNSSSFSAIALATLEVGAELLIRTSGRRPYRFIVTECSASEARVIALGELRGGVYSSPRRAALLGGRHANGFDATALRLGDGAVFLVDAVAVDSGASADRIVTSAIRELQIADRIPEAA